MWSALKGLRECYYESVLSKCWHFVVPMGAMTCNGSKELVLYTMYQGPARAGILGPGVVATRKGLDIVV